MDAGDYYFALGNGAHEALNNILAAKNLTDEQAARIIGTGDASKTFHWVQDALDTETYSTSVYSGGTVDITTRFQDVDINYWYGTDENSTPYTYLSRSDWQGTYPQELVLMATQEMLDYMLSEYLVLQSQVLMALCIAHDFDHRSRRITLPDSLVYWFCCAGIVTLLGVLDYQAQTYLISLIRLILVWVFSLGWQFLFFRAKLSSRFFTFFYATIILLSGISFCNIVDSSCVRFGFGILPWLRSRDSQLVYCILIALRKLLVYTIIWAAELLCLRHHLGRKWSMILNRTVLLLYGFLALLTCGLFLVEFKGPVMDLGAHQNYLYYLTIFCCELGFSILALIIIIVLEKMNREAQLRAEIEADLKLTQKLWQLDQRQYEFIRDNVELINRKCHDMRHYLNLGVTNSPAVQAEMQDLSDTITKYDSVIHTGNPVCDITLSDKSMECMRKGIDFICVVDGAALSFVDEVSLYSLLGNALENAIEHVQRFPDPEQRLITLNVSRNGFMVVIRVENMLCDTVQMADGLPVSQKGDPNYHGFGIKSMRSIAEKYGGWLEVITQNGFFQLLIVLPDPRDS